MAEAESAPELREDRILGGRVRLLQPTEGYRVAIDPVFLAAAVPAGPGDLVLELGSGAGAAALCLAWREPGCRVMGIEIDRDIARVAMRNVELNSLTGRVDVMVGDVMHPPPRLAPGSFHHAMMNPPFMPAGVATPSPQSAKARATVEGEAQLGDWVRCAHTMLRPKGNLVIVHRADRLEEILAALHGRFGEIVLFPLWPGGNRPAARVLVRARKGVQTPTRLAPGLVLHEPDGRYTAAAEAVLREAAGLIL
ncbi:MAG: tRNA1(Val) (adenine(37)-N6)-methyltransferase [Pseudomonadota bacterium]